MAYEGYLSMLRAASEEVAAIVSQPPEGCPQCGKPVTGGPRGELHCTFDGWIWDGKPVTYG